MLFAQEAGASAVVVTDTRVTDKWFMIMYGDPENAQVTRGQDTRSEKWDSENILLPMTCR